MASFVEWDLPDILEDINGNDQIYYEGNRNLKKAGVQLPYSDEHITEFIKCKNDIFYFAEKYYHIRDLDEGILKIKLRKYQKNMLTSFQENRNTIVNATRQCVVGQTYINIRNKKTSEIVRLEIKELYEILKRYNEAIRILETDIAT